jgi:hypothetical protein
MGVRYILPFYALWASHAVGPPLRWFMAVSYPLGYPTLYASEHYTLCHFDVFPLISSESRDDSHHFKPETSYLDSDPYKPLADMFSDQGNSFTSSLQGGATGYGGSFLDSNSEQMNNPSYLSRKNSDTLDPDLAAEEKYQESLKKRIEEVQQEVKDFRIHGVPGNPTSSYNDPTGDAFASSLLPDQNQAHWAEIWQRPEQIWIVFKSYV